MNLSIKLPWIFPLLKRATERNLVVSQTEKQKMSQNGTFSMREVSQDRSLYFSKSVIKSKKNSDDAMESVEETHGATI